MTPLLIFFTCYLAKLAKATRYKKRNVNVMNFFIFQVQEAVANCLHPLVPAIRDECPKLVSKLMTVLLESENYGERKGAAYGLASLVKGMGILALKQLDIMNQLTNAIQVRKESFYPLYSFCL